MVTLQVGQQLTGGGTVVSHDAPTFSLQRLAYTAFSKLA